MFLLLPNEILILSLCYLDLEDLLSVARVNLRLRDIVSYPILRYRIATQFAGVENNPKCSMPLRERLALLEIWEHGWESGSFDLQVSVETPYLFSNIHALTDGVYIMGDAPWSALLHCLQLPKRSADPVEWKKIDLEKPVGNICIRVHLFDLIAISMCVSYNPPFIRSTPSPTDTEVCTVEVTLKQFSTENPHPSAKKPLFFVSELPHNFKEIEIPTMDIAGVNLAVLISVATETYEPDFLYIFNWTTGEKKMKIEMPDTSCICVAFLSSELIVVPNIDAMTLEIWAVPESPPPLTEALRPLLSLGLPPSSGEFGTLTLRCHISTHPADSIPNNNCNREKDRPFRPSLEDALLGCAVEFDCEEKISFMMYARCIDVLALCGHVMRREHATATLVNDSWVLPFAAWGPSLTRWFPVDSLSPYRTATSSGTRVVWGSPQAEFRMLDFHPAKLKIGRKIDSGSVPTTNETRISDEALEEFVSWLPFTSRALPSRNEDFHFDAVLIDEEWLIMLKVCNILLSFDIVVPSNYFCYFIAWRPS
ncbi:hypothetical protein H0H81_003363 [Sphagnurus paluster]|uniref:F-box domain-containing protein n=1 Tax=Sphagnurus paluster TaxID=117069 RepID=A0A9P7GN41_9AGAR|nr:hypothetical protein H0H81_003363 [Sphagnurus paluster]